MDVRHYRQTAGAYAIPYRVTRGDQLLQDIVTDPKTIRAGLDELSKYGGALAYTPEMVARFQTVLQRRFETNDGTDNFEMPNYAPYTDPELAAFYGCDTAEEDNIRIRKENYDEIVERLVKDTVREIEPEMAGLAQMMNWYRQEEWGRYGVQPEEPYVHDDPDVTLFRNPSKDWSTIAIPAATSEKSNVIDLYGALPDFTFETPNEAWLIDQRGRFYDDLPTDRPPALGW